MTERIKNKLKESKGSLKTESEKPKGNDKEDSESEEEYYLGKDRVDERKRQTYD